MTEKKAKIKALGLSSGGLDSILAGVVLQHLGIDVEWVSFETPFFNAEKAKQAAKDTGIFLYVKQITEKYLPMLLSPNAGYGKHMNPCKDCHALMFRLAGEIMAEIGASFLFSGEVVGQRPMSQTMSSLRYVEKHSGMEGYILRPLSAQILPETIVEKKGWVARGKLYGFSGRSRKPQMTLAEKFGIKTYPTPGGGCLLTEEKYAKRLRDLFAHQDTYPEKQLELLQFGRHLRIEPKAKLIVGRTQAENEQIKSRCDLQTDMLFKTIGFPGPTAILSGGTTKEEVLNKCAAICAGYSKGYQEKEVSVEVFSSSGKQILNVVPMPPLNIQAYLL